MATVQRWLTNHSLQCSPQAKDVHNAPRKCVSSDLQICRFPFQICICWYFCWVWQIPIPKQIQITIWWWDEQACLPAHYLQQAQCLHPLLNWEYEFLSFCCRIRPSAKLGRHFSEKNLWMQNWTESWRRKNFGFCRNLLYLPVDIQKCFLMWPFFSCGTLVNQSQCMKRLTASCWILWDLSWFSSSNCHHHHPGPIKCLKGAHLTQIVKCLRGHIWIKFVV